MYWSGLNLKYGGSAKINCSMQQKGYSEIGNLSLTCIAHLVCYQLKQKSLLLTMFTSKPMIVLNFFHRIDTHRKDTRLNIIRSKFALVFLALYVCACANLLVYGGLHLCVSTSCSFINCIEIRNVFRVCREVFPGKLGASR
jgi:hypothetical protein